MDVRATGERRVSTDSWPHERWVIVDSRNTAWRMGMNCYLSREQAKAQIASWVERDARGVRQDIHEKVPFMVPKLLKDDET